MGGGGAEVPGKDEEHAGAIEEVAGAGDGELRPGPAILKRMVWPSRTRAHAEPPRLDVDAAIPEAGLGDGDRNVNGPGDVEADEFVVGGGVSHVDWLVVDGDGEGGGAQFRRNGDGLHARGGEDHAREREHRREEKARGTQNVGSTQEART